MPIGIDAMSQFISLRTVHRVRLALGLFPRWSAGEFIVGTFSRVLLIYHLILTTLG